MNKYNFQGKQIGKFARQTLGKLQERRRSANPRRKCLFCEGKLSNPRGEILHLKGKLVTERNPATCSRKKAKFLLTKLKVRERCFFEGCY